MTKTDVIFGSLIVTNLVALFIAGYEASKLKEVKDELEKGVTKIVNGEVEISDEYIDKCVDRAVDREVRYQVNKATEKCISGIIKSFETEVKNLVEDEFKIQQYDVKKEMQRQIGQIDIRDIKREVVREAKDAAAKKLKADLEDISDKYTEQLDSMTSIYSTIASKIESIGE